MPPGRNNSYLHYGEKPSEPPDGWLSEEASDRNPAYVFLSNALRAIGNFITNLDRSDRSEDLSVNFPKRVRRTMMNRTTVNSHSQEQRRVTVVGQLFRLRKCELKVDDEEQPNSPQHQKPNPKLRRVSSRVIGSTVIFPREDDDYSLGFE